MNKIPKPCKVHFRSMRHWSNR